MLSEQKQKYRAFFEQMADQMKKGGRLPRGIADCFKFSKEVSQMFYESIIDAIRRDDDSDRRIWDVYPNSSPEEIIQRVTGIDHNPNILNNVREAFSEHIPESSIAFEEKQEVSLEFFQNSQNEKKSCQLKKNEGDEHKSLQFNNPIQFKKNVQIQKKQDEIIISNEPVQVENKIPNFQESNMKRNVINYQKSLVQNSQVIDKRQRPKSESPAPNASEPYACQII